MGELRLLSYNVKSLRLDADAVAETIRACRPDVVAVQEAPRALRWRSKRAALARRCGLVVATADRPAGLMLMTTLSTTVAASRFRLLSKQPGRHQRAVCVADLDQHGERWTVASVHFSLDADERLRHLDEIEPFLAPGAGPNPLVLAGDLNEEAGGPVWQRLTARLTDAYAATPAGRAETFSARNPRRRIDGILVDPGVEVVECRAVDDVPAVRVASDHLPVLAVLRR